MRHCTDEVLVREVAADPLLSSYRWVAADPRHRYSVHVLIRYLTLNNIMRGLQRGGGV